MAKSDPFGLSPLALPERVAFLESLLASSTEYSIIAKDLQGRIVAWNEGARRIYGYEPEEIIGKSALLLHDPDDVRTGRAQRIIEAAREKGSWSGEIARRRKDGSQFTALVTITVRRDAEGHANGFTLISRDITAALQAQRELAASRDLLSSAIAVSPHGIVLVDPAGSVVLVNREACAIFGYSESELVGRSVDLLLPPGLRGEHTAHRADYLRSPVPRQMGAGRELVAVRKDGRQIVVEIGLAPVKKDDQQYVIASVVDVTARNEASARLQWMSLAVEQSPIAVVMTDVDGNIEYVNAAFTANTGYRSEEVVGKNPRILKSGETPPDVYRDLWDTIRNGRVWRGDLVNRRKDGTLYHDAMWVFPIKGSGGRITRLLALKEDVTKQRSLEQQLRQAQRLESVGRLAGGVAHDFNNILTAILGYSELSMERCAPGTEELEDLKEIKKAAERASGLTRQLLAFSRQQVLQPVVLNPNELVENLQKMLGRIVGEDVRLKLVLAPDAGNIRADPGQIEQVLMNLVVNARDAMPDGGSLLVETGNAELDAQYAEDHSPVSPGSYVLLAVSDTGTGIPPEVKARIFEPFFTTKGLGKGTGLGLSTVYGIVKQSGGYVWVYSEVDRGTTFKIYLPRVEAPTDAGVAAIEPERLNGTETILLAEDDETLRALTRNVLARYGYRVLDAPDPAAAEKLAGEYSDRIHLVLTDVIMPGASGRDLARAIGRRRPDAKVLYISGYTGEAMVHHGLAEPGVHYLQKPYTPQGLARKVREVLSRG